MKSSPVIPVVCFTSFVLWLLAVVMDGPLLWAAGISDATDFFLPAHVLSLLLVGIFCPPALFNRVAPPACILCVILTMAVPMAGPGMGAYLLVLLGVSGAFIAIGACTTLRLSEEPLLCAAVGLVAANLLLWPFSVWADGGFLLFAAISLPLVVIPVYILRLPEPEMVGEWAGPWHYLLFIFAFQVVSGLMYSFIMPAYNKLALLPGIELFFYILAVVAAFRMERANRDLALVCGVILGMGAFTLLQIGNFPLPINLGMFAMQAGAGFIDVIIIAVLLAFPSPVRGFGIGLATICAGIGAGKIVGYYFSDMTESIVMVGHVVLNLSILALYFVGRHHYRLKEVPADIPSLEGADTAACDVLVSSVQGSPTGDGFTIAVPEADIKESRLPDHLRLILSEREYAVLESALEGRTYRETARKLDISESTVKTYMYRIYEKMGVRGKKKLFEKLNSL